MSDWPLLTWLPLLGDSHHLWLTPTVEVLLVRGTHPADTEEWSVVCPALALDRDIQQPADVKAQALELVVSHLQAMTYDVQQLLERHRGGGMKDLAQARESELLWLLERANEDPMARAGYVASLKAALAGRGRL